MIIEEFNIDVLKLNYFVGLTCIEFDGLKYELNQFLTLIEEIQERNKDFVILFFEDQYVVNKEHIYSAIYFAQRAFSQEINISNKKNIEILLYLATKRQIKHGIENFGVKRESLQEGRINICFISPENNIEEIFREILKIFNAKEIEFEIKQKSIEKYKIIKNF